MEERSAVVGDSPVACIPSRALRRGSGPANTQCTVEARLQTTVSSGERLVDAVSSGPRDFVLSSTDGRISVRVRLAVADVSTTDHHTSAGWMIVDWSRGIVANGTARATLSRTDLKLLSLLLDGAGSAVPRATLVSALWPPRQPPRPDREKGLAVYVCNLRKRLETIGLGDALETVRGAGYRVALAHG